MDTARAIEIVRALADGRDPATGHQFPPDSPYQQADTVRALHVALEAMEKGNQQRAARPVDPNKPKVGTAWTPEEETRLSEAFAAQKPIPEIAAAHGRTKGAITSRLVKLGLIQDTATFRAGQGNRPAAVPTPPPPPATPHRPKSTTPQPVELTEEEKNNLPF